MRLRSLIGGFAASALLFPVLGCSGYPVYDVPGVSFAPPISEGLQQVAFMNGCWRGGAADGPTAEEHFSIGGAGTMMGWGRTTRNGRLGSWEFMRIFDDVNEIVYEAWPNGERSPARFVLTNYVVGAQAVFEDPDHDFPKRIRYQLIQPDLLQVTVDGGPSGGGDATQTTMVKVSCETR